MKRLLFVAILAAIGFYGIWPALSAYGIYNGIETKDETVLEQKVDWPSVRASFKEAIEPVVAQELEKQANKAGGNNGALTGALGASIAPQIVNVLVETYMTPKGLIQLASTGGKIDLEAALGSIPGGIPGQGGMQDLPGGLGGILEGLSGDKGGITNLEGLGGLFGGKQSGQKKASGKSNQDMSIPALGIDNIKAFHFNSPTELEMAISQEAKARNPDVTAVMGFKDMDWKLVKIIPHL